MTQNKKVCENKLNWLNANYVSNKYKLEIETNGAGFKRLVVLDSRNVEVQRVTDGVSTYSDMCEVLRALEFVLWLDKQSTQLKDCVFLTQRKL